MDYQINETLKPSGDQPEAIERLIRSIRKGNPFQTLLGVTGSGKTFTMAHTIAQLNRQALVLSPNKTLAAQLYREFKEFFPDNKVEFFISYYDYYQPEAYLPKKDVYIEKETEINDMIQRMRLSALTSVITRTDVIVVSSVSCIYASGDPQDFRDINLTVRRGQKIPRREMTTRLVQMQYERNEEVFKGGTFHIKGDIMDIYPSYEEIGIRIEFFDDEIDAIYTFDPMNRNRIEELDRALIYPAREYITSQEKIDRAIVHIEQELHDRRKALMNAGKLLEAQRLDQRTRQDLEMLKEVGYCSGIENYARHFDGRVEGESPWTLMDYFQDDYIFFIDESHIAVPQIRAMYNGDRSRKLNLVEYGFRLPSAMDNRPLTFDEFLVKVPQTVFVSATPGDYERERSQEIIQQVIRPTGLIDPLVEVRPAENQVDDLLDEIRKRRALKERVLVLTLTKSMAERLSDYLQELGIRSLYLHSELGTVERVEVLRKLRKGEIEVVVGINLLREGLDLPEVSLAAILDADKEGFLRSQTTLIQIIGRASRNVNGMVILYADKMTHAMERAIEETNRRRELQQRYNQIHNITPETIRKAIEEDMFAAYRVDDEDTDLSVEAKEALMMASTMREMNEEGYTDFLEEEMKRAAAELRFEDAARLRDEILRLKEE